MGYLEESQAAGREILPDLVRAFALIGIALVNVGVISYSMMESYHGGGFKTPIDTYAYIAVNSLFTFKSYTLFSFMFGVGFAYQIASAHRKGVKFGGRYTRRIIGLAILGLLHVALLFQGDILVIYAILGSILYLFRNASARTLTYTALGIYLFQILLVAFFALAMTMGMKYAPDDMAIELARMEEMNVVAHAVYGDGTFTGSIVNRFKEWTQIITFGMLMQGLGAFAFFLLGFAAVKSDIINKANAPMWKRFRRVFLPIGVIGSIFGAWVISLGTDMMDPTMMLGMLIVVIFAPFSTAGYLGLIAKWASRPHGRLKAFMARGGTATLTAYLMHGLIMSLVFNNYGLGYFAKLSAAQCILIALVTALFTIAFASLWRKKFARGPMEMLLRGWTYLGEK